VAPSRSAASDDRPLPQPMSKKLLPARLPTRSIRAMNQRLDVAPVLQTAFAFWSSTGTGDGTATTGQAVQFVITEGAKAGTLAPGNLAGQTVAFTVSNPGPGQLYLGTVTVTLADAAGVAWAPVTTQPTPGTMRCQRLCPAGHSHAGRPDPGGSTAFAGASIGFNDKSTNQDACKGATIQLLYTANPD